MNSNEETYFQKSIYITNSWNIVWNKWFQLIIQINGLRCIPESDEIFKK